MEPGLLPAFFTQVTRRSFGDLSIEDPPVARYLIELLTRFARTEALSAVQRAASRRLGPVAESLLAIGRAWEVDAADFNPSEEPALRRHIGDYTLFMTGIFRDHVERLAVTAYYEREGGRDEQPRPPQPLRREPTRARAERVNGRVPGGHGDEPSIGAAAVAGKSLLE